MCSFHLGAAKYTKDDHQARFLPETHNIRYSEDVSLAMSLGSNGGAAV